MNWQRLILSHLYEKDHKGILIGASLTDTKITLVAGKAHLKHTEGGDFREATWRAVRHGLMRAGCTLLEPYYSFRLEVPSEVVGRAMADLQTKSADFEIESADGAFTCCAPFLFGQYPADPVCSSFLVAGEQSLLFTGNDEIIKQAYPWFEAWEQSLLSRSDDYIVNYTYYGDWAAPAYACRSFEDANSAVTDGRFMSTGFSYYNCKALARMAKQLGNADKQAEYEALADKIKTAMLAKWGDAESAKMAGGFLR